MQDLLSLMNSLRRPRLLVRTARIGADDYRREKHLGRILPGLASARSGPVLMKLIEIEASLDASRRGLDASYSVARHVEVLAAMLGEARLMRERS